MSGENGEDFTGRADKVLVQLGHFSSRTAAQAAIAAELVTVNGRPVSKASQVISSRAKIAASPAHPWVSRGGVKLAHGLDVFGIDVGGLHCLDVGASTGGFTQVLLARGARSVVAVDVGRGQLHALVAGDGRVVSLEGKDARALTAADLGEAPDLVVCDASFISLSKVLGVALSLAGEGARLLALFKPQFEVGREHVGKGGIVRDRAAARAGEEAFVDWLGEQGWRVEARSDSPITGGDGNAERLVLAVRGRARV